MATHRVPLSRTEEAFVAMVMEERRAAYLNADEMCKARLSVMRNDKGIPLGPDIRIEPRTEASPAFVEYETPDIAPPEGPPRPAADSRSEKSTAPESAEGA